MSKTDIEIRAAQTEDIESMTELAICSFRDTYEADNDPEIFEDYVRSELNLDQFHSEFSDSDNVFLIAAAPDSGRLIGYAKLRKTMPGAGVDDPNAIEIERIYADSNFIGRGVGAALMQACLDTSHQLGHQTIWLGVWKPNTRAIRFYERWGFQVVGERFFDMGKEPQEDLVMSRVV